MITCFIVFTVILSTVNPESRLTAEESKRMFKKLFVKNYMEYRRRLGNNTKLKKIDLNNALLNISNSKIIDDITKKLTNKVVRQLTDKMKAKANEDIVRENPANSIEQIEILLGSNEQGIGQQRSKINAKDALERHQRNHHVRSTAQVGEKPVCNQCGKEFSTVGNMRKHMKTHERKISVLES